MFKPAVISVALSLVVFARAQASTAPAWGQCGGQGYTGPTACASGSACVYSNQWYSQCVPGSVTSGTPPPTSTSTSTATSSTATTSSTSQPAPTGSSSAAKFQTQGRVSTSGTSNTLVWPYTGLTFSFKGTQASVAFTTTGQNAFTISVDGGAPSSKIELDAAGKISTGTLSSGTHTVEIHKVSEPLYGSATFTNSSITTDGTFVDAAPLSRRIEFVGDSITCGYGVDGVLPCAESTQTENAGKTYAALTGKSLNAEVSLIAWSGRGVLRNYPNSDGSSPDPPMPTLWKQLNPLDSSSVYSFPATKTPQAVVINLGTNDFAYLSGSTAVRSPITLSQYQTGISNFVSTIFGKYPNTKVFLVSSPMLGDDYPSGQNQKTTQETALKNVASQIKNTYFVSLPTQGSDVGCDYHPLPATHQSMAALLTPAIKQQLGW